MKQLTLLAIVLFIVSCSTTTVDKTIVSPEGKVSVHISQTASGALQYEVTYDNQKVIEKSNLGFEFAELGRVGESIKFLSFDSSHVNSIWKQPWGEDQVIRDVHEGYTFHFKDKSSGLLFDITFKLFDDGLGFRYGFPAQEGIEELVFTEELTQFTITGDHQTWWLPADYDSYEYLYNTTRVSEIDSSLVTGKELLAAVSIKEKHAVSTPLTMKSDDDYYISIHEAALTDFTSMTLRVEADKRTLAASLVPDPNGFKAKVNAPYQTPWRTIQLGKKPGDLLESKLILNLNEPNKVGDQDWIKPGKYIGIWWEMHLGTSSWDISAGKHGATTKHAKEYIDFAAKYGFDGVLIEGWNTGWERWIGFPDREGVFDFITPYPDYDLKEVVEYAQSKGTNVIMHHETSAAIRTYEQQLDTAYNLMKELGIHGVKTGYVGPIIPDGYHHHGQMMVNHYRKVLDKALESEVMVFAHEPIKATGLRRTYPNMMAREGLRGSEFNAWGGGNPPEHITIVPFTRMLGGPVDYTPGIFKLDISNFLDGVTVPTTLAYQLAEYVVIYSPVQMASDLIEHYEEKRDAFQFILDVPVDWEKSVVVDAEIGDYAIIARLEKGGYDWYLGAVTDENAREMEVTLDFLNNGTQYEAQIYRDADDADFENNPEAYVIEKKNVKKNDILQLNMARGGGVAIRFKAL